MAKFEITFKHIEESTYTASIEAETAAGDLELQKTLNYG